MFSTYLSVSILSLVKFLAIETNIFLFSLILPSKSSHRVQSTRSCTCCLVSHTWSWICEKKDYFFLFCGIKIANHRFLVKNILATLGKDDQEKGTDLWEKRKTRLPFAPWPFWKLFNTQSQWSGPFIIRMATMSQILWVFPHVSYLGSAKVVQSQAKNWRQKSANPMLFPHMSRGSTPRDGCW